MNGDVRSELATSEFKKGDQIEYFHGRILILQQDINIYVETVSDKIILLQYIKELSTSEKLKAFITS